MLGIDYGRLLVALGIVFVFLVLRSLFTTFVLGFLRRIAARTDTTLDDALLNCMQGPVRFVLVILGLFTAVNYLELSDQYAVFGGQLIRSLVIFDLFWALYQITGPVSSIFSRLEEVLTKEMVAWLISFLHIAIVFIGAAAILEVWGIRIGTHSRRSWLVRCGRCPWRSGPVQKSDRRNSCLGRKTYECGGLDPGRWHCGRHG